uniref:Peroxisomal membrane protein 11B n=2 Tax=Clastoptera arizonana TaxID=38151 RepID=A0A1B6E369_9HEMI
MDKIVKLNNQTAGRDKLARLIQYASRFAWYYIQRNKSNQKSVDTLKSLEFTFSTFRKLLRLGRFTESLYASLNAMNYPSLIVRITVPLSKISNAIFLLCDHLLWATRVGLANLNTERWSNMANRYWLYSIIMNLIRDIYEINHILKTHQRKLSSRTMTRKNSMLALAEQHKDVVIDTLKNSCDVFIPLTALGYTSLSPGIIGFLGVVSSLAGIFPLLDPMAKLTPS